MVSLAAVFGELASTRRWVCYRDRHTKAPIDAATGHLASSTDPATWHTLDVALRRCDERGLAGVGIVLRDGLGGVDLDGCLDPETGKIAPWAQKIIDGFGSYAEISPSGTGVKIFAAGAPEKLPAHTIRIEAPAANGKRPGVECYTSARYFTVTGQILNGVPDEIRDCGEVGGAWDRMVRLLRARDTTGGNGPAPAVEERIPTGNRNQTLASLAGTMRRRGLEEPEILAALREINSRRCDPPLPTREVDGIAASVARYTPADAMQRVRSGYKLPGSRERDELDPGRSVEPAPEGTGVTLDDFYAVMPDNKYLFIPSRDLWPAASVNARVAPIGDTKASAWLAEHRAVEQLTWAPGEPEVIEDRLISHGGWIDRPGCKVFNLYRPPVINPGDPNKADRWLEHVHRIFPSEADHIITYFAHRVQRPAEKINHALVLVGPQGTGKDTVVEGPIPAVGSWNVQEVSPDQLLGRFNGFLKAVILRVSEARDLGDSDRYRLYEHLKTYTAAPPFVLRIDEKNIREYVIPNVCGVVVTSNHIDGIYLPADDRRHFIAYTELTKENFTPDYWNGIYRWYQREGYRHIAAYLAELDISDFDPKAPPPKTAAFWRVVDAGRAPEDADLADALDRLGTPNATTLSEIAGRAESSFGDWLRDRRNNRQIPHRMEVAGYVATRNDAAQDGKWKVGGKRQVIYSKRELPIRDRIEAARVLAEAAR